MRTFPKDEHRSSGESLGEKMKRAREQGAGAKWEISRRDFLKASGIIAGSGLLLPSLAGEPDVLLRFGIVTVWPR